MHKRLLRVEEAAELMNVSRWTVYRWVGEGHLRGARVGRGGLRIMSESVAALIGGTVIASSSALYAEEPPARLRKEDPSSCGQLPA